MAKVEDILQEAQSLIGSQKPQQALDILLKCEKKINKKDENYSLLIYSILMSLLYLKNWQKIIEYSNKTDFFQVDQDIQKQVISFEFAAYMNLQLYDKIQELCQKILSKESFEEVKYLAYFYYGCYYNQIKKYNLAKENFDKALKLNNEKNFNSEVLHNYSFTYLQLGKYTEALQTVEEYLKDKDKEIFILMVKSEALVKLNRLSEAVESLELAKEIIETKSYDNTMYFKSEMEWIEQKFSPQNIKFINQIIDASKQANKIEDQQKKQELLTTVSDVIVAISDKHSTSIDDLIKKRTEECIKNSFSSDTLKVEQSKIQGEQLVKSPELKDYDDSFKQQATLIFVRSQILLNGGKVLQKTPLDYGVDLLQMVPLFGATIHSVVSGAKAFYDGEKAKTLAQAIVEFGKTVGEFESKMIRISAKVMSDKEYQEIITNKTEEKISSYKQQLKQLKEIYEKAKQSTFKVDLLEKTPQRILGAKDAEELIGCYIATGYLSSYDKDNQVDKSVEFLLSNEEERKEKNKIAQLSAKASVTRKEEDAKCCQIF